MKTIKKIISTIIAFFIMVSSLGFYSFTAVASPPMEKLTYTTAGNWLATVFGDMGGQAKIEPVTVTNPITGLSTVTMEFAKDADGNDIEAYAIDAVDETTVNMRAGTASDGSYISSMGKISNTSVGGAYYYQKLTADDDFTISGTATINELGLDHNQIGFGITVLDDLTPDTHYPAADISYADSITAGRMRFAKAATDPTKGDMSLGWARKDGNLINNSKDAAGGQVEDFAATLGTAAPIKGDRINISLQKEGTIYTLRAGNDIAKIDSNDLGLSITDDIYVGFFVARAADITWSNISLYVVGEEINTSFEFGGQGNVSNKIGGDATLEENAEGFTLSAYPRNNDVGVGKISSSEDTYAYYAAEMPSNSEYTLTADITLDYHLFDESGQLTTNRKQTGLGFIMFDSKYPSGTNYVTDNSLMITPYTEYNTTETADLVLRTRDGGPSDIDETNLNIEQLITGAVDVGGSVSYSIKAKKTGNTVRISITDINGNIYKTSTDVSDLFNGPYYVGFFAARNSKITVENLKFSPEAEKSISLSITSMPQKTNYYIGEAFDTSGLTLEATYADGTVETITDPFEYTILGFDDINNSSFLTKGTKELTIKLDEAEAKFNIQVNPIKILSATIEYYPAYAKFIVGNKFNTLGLSVKYILEDGTTKILKGSENKLTFNCFELTDNIVLTDDMVGSGALHIEYPYDENIDNNGQFAYYNIDILDSEFIGIEVTRQPIKSLYYINDEADYTGMIVSAVYMKDGVKNYTSLSKNEYTVSGLDTSKTSDLLTLTVTYNKDTSLTTTFDVAVTDDTPIKPEIITHPKYTYAENEVFNPQGLNISVAYISGKYKDLTNYGIYDGENYKDVEGNIVDPSTLDYWIDITNFETNAVGETYADIIFPESTGFSPIELVFTVVENKDYIWKAALMGASSMGVNDVGTSYLKLTKKDGTIQESDKNTHEIEPQAMIGGILPDVQEVQIQSWDGTGKVSGDQDGMAYYYTKVSSENNFKLSADIKVNGYIRDINSLTSDEQIRYNEYYNTAISEGKTDEEAKIIALDKLRSGQEAFGIMARDVIPLAGNVVDGQYMGGINNHMTINPNYAIKTQVTYTDANGVEKTVETPADIFEAYMNKLVVTDDYGSSYKVNSNDVGNTFTSNIVIAGACTDSMYPTDTTSSSYARRTLMNRINIMFRRGVSAPDGGGKRVGIFSTTDSLPQAGDVYNITLERINGGYMITTYDYQTDKTVSKKVFEEDINAKDLLQIQDPNNIYVGFFAARWADCTVSNIKLYETDPATDPIYPKDEEAITPKVYIDSPLEVEYENYSLGIRVNNENGGLATISQNGETIYSEINLTNESQNLNVQLAKNSTNMFTVLYYPSEVDNLTSYEPVIYNFNVTHNSFDDVIDYPGTDGNIYIDPSIGQVTGCDSSATEIVIPFEINGVSITSIAAGAFLGCSNLTSIYIPNTVTSIYGDLFDYGTSATFYVYKDSYAETYAIENNISYVNVDDSTYPSKEITTETSTETSTEVSTETSTETSTEAPDTVDLGDVNNDRKVNFADAIMVLRYSADTLQLTDSQIVVADMNKDNIINFADAILILRKSATS